MANNLSEIVAEDFNLIDLPWTIIQLFGSLQDWQTIRVEIDQVAAYPLTGDWIRPGDKAAKFTRRALQWTFALHCNDSVDYCNGRS